MANEVHAGSPAAAQTPAEGAPNANASAAQNAGPNAVDKPVTLSELTAILAEHRNGINADIRKAIKLPAEAAAAAQQPAANSPQPAAKPDGLAERVNAIEARDAKQRGRERLSSIKTALIDGGVPAKNAERAAKVVLADHGGRVVVDDDFNVHYQDQNDTTTPIATWIGAYLKTEDGQFFLPAKKLAGGDGLSGNNAAGINNGGAAQGHPFAKLSYKEIMDHPNRSLTASYVRDHRAEYDSKKAAFNPMAKK